MLFKRLGIYILCTIGPSAALVLVSPDHGPVAVLGLHGSIAAACTIDAIVRRLPDWRAAHWRRHVKSGHHCFYIDNYRERVYGHIVELHSTAARLEFRGGGFAWKKLDELYPC